VLRAIDLVLAGLDEIMGLGLLDEDPVTFPQLQEIGLGFQRRSRAPVETVTQVEQRLAAAPLPTPAEPALGGFRDPRSPAERARELACAAAIPLLAQAAISLPQPILKGAAIAGLFLCGFEFAEDIS